ncbi:MAG TPA: M23 family metallopeptidase, partial [Candidatus Limnocylindria bacterium]|nr:M23 family metallopeptidase [Candidatus Limnocylindria bacterium]
MEYRFFKCQAEKMLALKQEYQDQLVAMNKAMQEYAKTKEQLMYLESAVQQQKKKDHKSPVAPFNVSPFPEGAKIFSSDQEKQEANSFVPVNRDISHLKKASIAYIKEQNLHKIAHRMRPDVWQDYMQELHEKNHPTATKTRGRRRGRRGGTHARARRYSYNYQLHDVPQDIVFAWPIDRAHFWLSSFFGPRRHPNGSIGFHYGIDMAAVRGTPVHPAAPGVVVEARVAPGYGKTVVVVHSTKY